MNSKEFSFDFQTIEEAAQTASIQTEHGRLNSSRLSSLPKLPPRNPFTVVETELDSADKRKRRERLERFAAEVKR